jgi:O-antigen ligase
VTYGAVSDAIITDAFFIHNSYLNILAKTGLFGLAAFVLMLGGTIVTAGEIAGSPASTPFERTAATACFGAMISLAVLTSVAPVLTAGDPAAYCGMLIGTVVALHRAHLTQTGVAPG